MKVFDQDLFFKEIKYEPHSKQWLFHNSTTRFRLLICGRRWGKTKCAANECLKHLISNENKRFWVVGPTYDLANKIFREVYWTLHRMLPNFVSESSEARMYIRLVNGCEVYGKSADNPVSLIGEGLDGVFIDEAAKMKREVWEEAIRPTLADRNGFAVFTTTPFGRNWLFELFTKGQDSLAEDWESWQFGTISNPYIPPSEVELARQSLPERAFRQEWLGEFIDDNGSVFRGVKECIDSSLKKLNTVANPQIFEQPQEGKMYVGGVDLAKHEDFTVIIIARADNKTVVYFDRFNQIDWNLQKERIKKASLLYNNARLVVDCRGVGDGIFDDLKRLQVNVEPFNLSSNAIKEQLIENLTIAIENREIRYPEIPELLNELQIFEYVTTPSGNNKYSAPQGYHDDIVLALAFLNTKLRSKQLSYKIF